MSDPNDAYEGFLLRYTEIQYKNCPVQELKENKYPIRKTWITKGLEFARRKMYYIKTLSNLEQSKLRINTESTRIN